MSRVEFTYSAYKNLMNLLQTGGYRVCSYHNWQDAARCVILRHDIDSSLDQALELARVEQKLGLSSTYFVLLSSDFYNVASRSSRGKLRRSGRWGTRLDCTSMRRPIRRGPPPKRRPGS